jgi:hypothetical protein
MPGRCPGAARTPPASRRRCGGARWRMPSSRTSAAAERARAPSGQSRTTAHPIHQSLSAQAVARKDLLVALKIDRVGQLTEHLADDLIRVPRTTEDPRGLLVRSERRRGRHATSIRSRSQAGYRGRIRPPPGGFPDLRFCSSGSAGDPPTKGPDVAGGMTPPPDRATVSTVFATDRAST